MIFKCCYIYICRLNETLRTELSGIRDIRMRVILLCRRLQKQVVEIGGWSSRWRLRLNEDKRVAIRFTRKLKVPHDNILMGNLRLPWSKSLLYLGVTLDQRLTFCQHIQNTVTRFSAARSAQMPVLCSRSSLALKIKVLLYIPASDSHCPGPAWLSPT